MSEVPMIMGNSLKTFVHYIFLTIGLSVVGCSNSFAAPTDGSAERCAAFAPELTIDHVWGGVRDKFDSVEDKDFIYIGYYDAQRWLSVMQINKCNGEKRKIRVPTRFGGWDAHNYIELALDDSHRLHVSGNMHASPLIYARMNSPDNLAGLDVLRAMVGSDEVQVTYPNFFRFPDGALGFSYRSGHSGDGAELINRFKGDDWVRWTSKPVFAPDPGENTVNAYPTDFIIGPDGYFHVAWVWRKNPDVETNFNVNYAKSRDLHVWKNSAGQLIRLPITPSSAEVVDSVSPGHGLFNNIRLGFDEMGRPVISYLKFDSTGATQLFHARREAAGWKSTPATDWKYRWDPRGRGTIPSEINFSGVKVQDGHLIEQVHQPEIGSKEFEYDDSLKIKQILGVDTQQVASPVKDRPAPEGTIRNVRAVREIGVARRGERYTYAISWFSLPANNRDKPRKCNPAESKCNFVYELILESTALSSSTVN